MNAETRNAIRQQIVQGIENTIESLSFEAKICAKIHDEKGLETVKSKLIDIEKRLEAANLLIKEDK